MSRKSSGIRLWAEPAEYNPDGTLRRRSSWIIRDGSRKKRTGCTIEERQKAECILADYIVSRYQPPTGKRNPSEILVCDVLNFYLNKVKAPREVGGHAEPVETGQRIVKLSQFWAPSTLADVTGDRCRQYVTWRTKQIVKSSGCKPRKVSVGTAGRELADLRAAINYHRNEGLCSEFVAVPLPTKGEPRIVWLTRSEAAKLLWTAWRSKQVMRDRRTTRDVGKHIARFVLVGLYSGTRHLAICQAAMTRAVGRGYIDLDRGVFFRRAVGAQVSKKQQTPVRVAPRLLTHLRRWRRLGIATHAVVEWNGKPVRSVRKGFDASVKASGLQAIVSDRLGAESEERITPHVLRHTAATWLMQQGIDLWEAAGFLGMTEQTLRDVYGHHHPDFQKGAADAISGRLRGQDGDRMTVNKPR